MREYVKPRIRQQVRGVWICFVPGLPGYVGFGSDPEFAYAHWLRKICGMAPGVVWPSTDALSAAPADQRSAS